MHLDSAYADHICHVLWAYKTLALILVLVLERNKLKWRALLCFSVLSEINKLLLVENKQLWRKSVVSISF